MLVALILFSALIFAFNALQAVASDIVQRLDGTVSSVDAAKRKLVVRFDHPVSGEHVEKEFFVSETAGFKHAKKMDRIKVGDLVTIDYREEGAKAVAVYVDVVPIERRPVTAGELAASLAKIKSAEKN